jgi:hypothetical protein
VCDYGPWIYGSWWGSPFGWHHWRWHGGFRGGPYRAGPAFRGGAPFRGSPEFRSAAPFRGGPGFSGGHVGGGVTWVVALAMGDIVEPTDVGDVFCQQETQAPTGAAGWVAVLSLVPIGGRAL